MSRHHVEQKTGGRRWALLRLKVFERDGWRCVSCGRAGRLECDHVKPLADGGDPWDMDNLQSLCRGCHVEKTRQEAENRRELPPGGRAWRALVRSMAGS